MLLVRRELLRRKRVGRTILLCTHFMDEAELLSDRIMIMRRGELQCSGSPIFLKNRFGFGYNMTVVLEPRPTASRPDDRVGDASVLKTGMETNNKTEEVAQVLLGIVQTYIPQATISRVAGKEVCIGIPSGEEVLFPACFDAIEESRSKLGIGAYGIENASLEEVFIRIAEDEEDKKDSAIAPEDMAESHTEPPEEISTLSTFGQVSVLFWKRVIIQKRDIKGTFFTVVVPALLVGLVLLVLTISVPLVRPPIQMSPDLFSKSNTGETSSTDVWLGGGIAYGNENVVDARLVMKTESRSFESFISDQYPHVNTFYDSESTSSRLLSDSLLSSINERNHNTRYGAVAFADIIPLVIEYNLDGVHFDKDSVAEIAGKLDPIEIQGFSVNSTVGSIFDRLYAESGLSDDSIFDARRLINSAEYATESIFQRSGYNRTAFVQDVRGFILDSLPSNESLTAFVEFIQHVADDILGGKLLIDETLSSIANRFINLLEKLDLAKAYDDFCNNSGELNYTFDRNVTSQEVDKIMRGLSKDLGLNANVSSAIVDVTSHFLHGATGNRACPLASAWLAYGLAEISELLLSDGVDISAVSMSSIRQFFDTLLGGNGQESGYLHVVIDSVTVDPRAFALNLTGVVVATGVVRFGPDDFTLEFGLNELIEMIPRKTGSMFLEIGETSSILHNASSPHAGAAFNQAFTETLFKKCSRDANARLISTNHPLPLTMQKSVEIRTVLSVLASMFIRKFPVHAAKQWTILTPFLL